MPKAPSVKPIVCEYLFYKLHGSHSVKWIKIPLVEIRLKSKEAEFGSVALVDSGSDRTFLPRQEAELLGLKPQIGQNGEPVKVEAIGAGGSFPCDVMTLPDLRLMHHGKPFQDFHGLNVWVPNMTEDIPYAILGRDYVFHRYEIAFDEGRRKISFRKV